MNQLSEHNKFIKNEVIFRNANQKVQTELKQLQTMAAPEGHGSLYENDDLELEFYCECANEKCLKRIALSSQEYSDIHQDKRRFIIIPNHEVLAVERVISTNQKYSIVQKHDVPPDTADHLETTSL